MNSPPIFKHALLDHTKTSIRLLQILPELSNTGLIQCEMWHDTTEATYNCLSYVWGSEDDQQEILINHKLFHVRKNLWNFMDVARKKPSARNIPITQKPRFRWWRNRDAASAGRSSQAGSRTFWIDAVSIDQSSILERNHQVAQMGLIYSKAAEVVAWLGLDKAIVRAVMFCNELGALQPRSHHKHTDFGDAWALWLRRDMELHGQLAQDFESFSCSPYWNRAWITQEILLARKLTILADNYECGPDGISLLSSMGYPWKSPSEIFIAYIDAIRGKRLARGSLLVQLLWEFHGRECMVPRDQIYSLVSVASDARTMPIDYGGTPDQFVDQLLRTVGHSLCLCSWLCIRETLRLSSLDYENAYTELIFKVQMRSSERSSILCPMCTQNDREERTGTQPWFLPTCIVTACGMFDGHYSLKRDGLYTDPEYFLQCRSDGRKEMELAQIEVETMAQPRYGYSCDSMINVYLKATVLEKILGHKPRFPNNICSNARKEEGYMSVYRGPPLDPRQQLFTDTGDCYFVQDENGVSVLHITTEKKLHLPTS